MSKGTTHWLENAHIVIGHVTSLDKLVYINDNKTVNKFFYRVRKAS